MEPITTSTAGVAPTPVHLANKPFAATGLVRDFDFTPVKLSYLVQGKHNLIRALSTAPLEEVLDIMKTNNISGLPIYDISKRKYIGILNFFDILVFIAFGSFKKEILKSEFEKEKISFPKTMAGDLLGISNSEKFIWNFESEDSLEAALEPFCKGVHRVIVNKRKKTTPSQVKGSKKEQIEAQVERSSSVGIVGPPTSEVKHRLLSQIDVVTFLYRWASDCSLPMLQRSLSELSLVTTLRGGSHSLVIVPETFTALDTMQKMYHSKVNAVGIVDGEGRLIANLSTTDLRYLTRDKYTSVFLPVTLFLHQLQGQKAAKPITAHPSSIFDEVMLKVVAGKVKRVWVVDEKEIPIGVVTLTDIISKFGPQDVTLIRPAEQTLRR